MVIGPDNFTDIPQRAALLGLELKVWVGEHGVKHYRFIYASGKFKSPIVLGHIQARAFLAGLEFARIMQKLGPI